MQTQNTNTKHFGVVINKSNGHYAVYRDGQTTLCSLSNKLCKEFEREFLSAEHQRGFKNVSHELCNLIAIGDHVTFILADSRKGLIVSVAARRNALARRAARPMASAHPFEQVIAANLDQVVPIFSAALPTPKWHMLDRYLVAAESCEIPSTIVITKLDLVKDQRMEKELLAVVERYQKIGYPVILTSAADHQGLDQFRQMISNRTSVLVGKSGVGKSSLLNVIEPDLGLRIKSVNPNTGKGRHTTTHLEMFTLASGGAIVDTPGTREFGLWGLDPQEISHYFPEMQPLLGLCKFGLSCQHDEEPGCAIRAAVMSGEISPYRYKSYLRLKADL